MKDDSILYHKHNPPELEMEEDLDDDELFRKAMAKVEPLNGKAKEQTLRVEQESQRGEESRRRKLRTEGQVVLPRDMLKRFLEEEKVESFYKAGYVEGGPQEWNQLLLKKLREGEFSVQAQLDLHGLSQREARDEIKQFIEECSRKNLTCVRIIHGKGKNSPNYIPVLKRQIPRWLSQKRTSRYLIAYTSARPVDGGVGAIYVLLRKT